jgi:hypothetical protein
MNFPGEFCGKLFSCMNNLRTHLYYHSEPKFICDFPNCDKKFYMRKRLRAHVKVQKTKKKIINVLENVLNFRYNCFHYFFRLTKVKKTSHARFARKATFHR